MPRFRTVRFSFFAGVVVIVVTISLARALTRSNSPPQFVEPALPNSTVIVEKVVAKGELVAAEVPIVIDEPVFTEAQMLNMPVPFSRTLLVYRETILAEARVDLCRVTAGDLAIAGRVLYLRLPLPRVVAHADLQRSRIVSQEEQVLSFMQEHKDLQSEAEKRALARGLQAAQGDGELSTKARLQSEEIVKALLSKSGFKQIVFIWGNAPLPQPSDESNSVE
jgi:hypothetical protein